jgi:hypothetical protein
VPVQSSLASLSLFSNPFSTGFRISALEFIPGRQP